MPSLPRSQKAQLAASKQKLESIVPSNPEQVEAMRFVLGFDEVMGHVGTGAGIGVNSLSTLTGRHLQADMLEFNRWANEKASLVKAGKGKDILHHYDARMDELVKRIQNRLGPTERFLFNNGTKDALFSGTPKSLRPGAITIGAAERVAQMATKAKVAGAALVVLDAALTCHKLANTAEGQKVETAYREIGGFITSLAVGAAVGVAVVSMATPVGWLGAVIISAGSAYGGKAIGEAVGNIVHTQLGDVFSLKDGKILNGWCR
ncbi:hypothetical protein [Limnobacter sp.]|uniref:hypothetical protein n=1 Tax=Limnobacter sp. TaxID=2003368 RepID=UPI003518B31E